MPLNASSSNALALSTYLDLRRLETNNLISDRRQEATIESAKLASGTAQVGEGGAGSDRQEADPPDTCVLPGPTLDDRRDRDT